MNKRVGILTGGGDCPGLNAVIRGAVRRALRSGWEAIGIMEGWRGMIDGKWIQLDLEAIRGILPRGGTILRSSRTNPLKRPEGMERIKQNFAAAGLDALIAIGGDDTQGVAAKLHEAGLHVIGVPKTIDNDLSGTDCTFGFDTAVNIVTEALDRLHTTAEAHNRVMVVEVMGRHAGWIAVASGIAGGADVVLIPEKPIDLDHVVELLQHRAERGRTFSIMVVAEGAKFADGQQMTLSSKIDEFGHEQQGGIGNALAVEIEKRTGLETRAVILGHIQRGGSPSAFDRILATRFGVIAMEKVIAGESGRMVALRGGDIVTVPFSEALTNRKVDPELYRVAETFFG
jgi:phosphofructokinase-like protein